MDKEVRKKGGWKRALRIFLKTLMWIFLLIVVVFILILTPPVQKFITGKATNWLEKKLDTKVEIGRLYFTLNGNVALDDVYIEDRSKDTLISAGEIRVDINLTRIIFGNGLHIESFRLDDATAKLSRTLPDTTFNFQFIADAFGSAPDTSTTVDTSAGMSIQIDDVELNRVRFVYKDVVTGNDVETSIGHFDTRVKTFDLDKMHFVVPKVNLREFNAKIIQATPLVIKAQDVAEAKVEASAEASPALQLEFGEIALTKSNVDYRDSIGSMFALANIGELNVKPKKIDLDNMALDLGNILLHDTKASVRFGKRGEARKAIEIENQSADSATTGEAAIRLLVNSLDVKNVQLGYDDDNNAPLGPGKMDYSHIAANVKTLQVKKFKLAADSIAGNITEASLSDQGGFDLQELKTNFLYANNQAYLQDLYLKTPGTEIKRNIAISYVSPEALAADIGNLEIDADLEESKILVADVLQFVPSLQQQPAFANPKATWYLDSRITGKVSNLNIERFTLSGLANTSIQLSGGITGLPNADNFAANLDIKEIRSSRADVSSFMPANSLPKNITLPNRFALRGKVNGGMQRMTTDLALQTDLGNASIKGTTSNITNASRAVYDVSIGTQRLDLGTILQDKETYGPVTATISAKGTGYDPKTANATFRGDVKSAVFKKYNYRNLPITGSIANQEIALETGMQDPNLHFALDAVANVAGDAPSVKLNLAIDSIKAHELNLTPDVLVYRGNITADFPVADPDNLIGELLVTQSLLVQKDQRVIMDTIRLNAGSSDTGRYIHFASDILNANIDGQYKLTEIGYVIQRAIHPYFAIDGGDTLMRKDPYDFTVNANVINGPVLKSFVPGLERMDSVALDGRFSDSAGWYMNLRAPAVTVGANAITNLSVNAGTQQDSAIQIDAFVQRFKSGNAIQLDSTSVKATLANNIIDFLLNIRGNGTDKYNVGGLFSHPNNNEYQFALKPQGLVLNYDNWSISDSNRIVIGENSVNAQDFTLSQGNQQLTINSRAETGNAPLDVSFSNFQIATLTGFVQTDSTLINGNLNGKAEVKDVMIDPLFTADLTVSDVSVKNDTVGNVQVLVNNQTANTYKADVTISGRGNDVNLNGNYYINNSTFDLDLNIRELPMTTAQAFSAGAIRDAKGSVNGQFDITGSPAKPAVNGALNFNNTGFNFAMLNNYLTIDNESIRVTPQGIQFSNFQIKDSAQNQLVLDGSAATTNFTNYDLDINIKSNNFRALNSTKKDNKIFWGQLYFNTDLHVSGTESAPVVDGRLKINKETKLTVVLPQSEPGVVDREGVVEFFDADAPFNDSLFLAAYDSLNTMSIGGAAVSVNIELDKEADLTLVIDEGNGDFLNVKGEALLTADVTPSGDITLAGTYELEEGAYELSFNTIRRRFEIVQGSKITWGGEPTDAIVDISAKYIANTAPLDLVKGQLGEEVATAERNTYLQRLPFEVMLRLQNKLMKPDITFDIILPDNKSYVVGNDIVNNVRQKLDQLRNEPAEMNKQVFALLLLNRFVAENPFNSSSGGLNAGTLARQSVSKLMTEQLNRLAGDLIAGVDLNFDVQSSEDYTTGERADRTDLNVGLSKRLLNDRLTVSVGSNFELEGPAGSNQQSSNIAGNVGVNYRLSQDGRYQLRAYRKNEFQGVIDGYVVETGVGFIFTLDYNRFRDIFRQKELRERRAARAREQRQQEGHTPNSPTMDSRPQNQQTPKPIKPEQRGN